jgi:hypothetical protein
MFSQTKSELRLSAGDTAVSMWQSAMAEAGDEEARGSFSGRDRKKSPLAQRQTACGREDLSPSIGSIHSF